MPTATTSAELARINCSNGMYAEVDFQKQGVIYWKTSPANRSSLAPTVRMAPVVCYPWNR
jgi:hypothetical protein